MARKVAITNLNASTIDILNVIRQNASLEYQNMVPEIDVESMIPKVGEILYGYPALANQFINALVNRIALVKVKSATFNNAYAKLKKGYLEFGETVEEVFVGIAKAREFSVEKAEKREFKRTLPDVRTAFHAINWKVQYPITIQQDDLRQAFTSIDGVQDLIAKIVDSVYTTAEYDEFLLFKYLLIKGIAQGKMFVKGVDTSNIKNAGIAFRGMSNQLTFMSNKYNADGVTTTTPKKDQYIFMDSEFNAQYDVEVLASAFNMDKADFMGRLLLIDDWTTFDNDRFDVIRAESDMLDEITEEELALMQGVKGVLVDEEWFQVYDNNTVFTDTKVASGLYWNYFLNIWKTVSSSPFSNAVVFVDDIKLFDKEQVSMVIENVQRGEGCTIITLSSDHDCVTFEQTEEETEAGIAVHKYGVYIIPDGKYCEVRNIRVNGKLYEIEDGHGTLALDQNSLVDGSVYVFFRK